MSGNGCACASGATRRVRCAFAAARVERALPAGRELEFIAPSPGGLLQILEGPTHRREVVLFELGVNFLDESETNLRDQSTADVGALRRRGRGLRAESGPASDPLFWLLLTIGGDGDRGNWCLLAAGREQRRA